MSASSLASSTYATSVYFDVNGTTAGSGVAASGYTWSGASTSSTLDWSTSSAGTATTTRYYSYIDPVNTDVYFSAGTDASGYSYTVTENSGGVLAAHSITLEEGTLTLTGSSSAGFNLGAGGITLLNNNSMSLSYAMDLAMVSNQTWNSNGSSIFTITSGSSTSDAISGNYALTLAGTGTFAFAGAAGNSMASTTINGATVTTSSAAAFGTGPLTLNAGSLAPSGGSLAVANNYSVAGGFSFGGGSSNHLTLSGAGTTSGAETITLNDTVTTGTIFGTSGAASTLALGGNLTFAGSGGATVNDVISGTSCSLTDSASGTVVLAGANTFTGGVALTGGTLVINNANALGTTAGTFTINAGTTLASTAGMLTTAAYTQSWAGDFTLAGVGADNLYLSGTATLTGNRTITVTGTYLEGGSVAIGDSGNGYSLTKAGAGSLYLFGTSTYSGGTNISAGTIEISSAAALGSGNVSIGAGTLQLHESGYYNDTSTLAANITLSSSSSAVESGSSTLSDNFTVTGLISGSGTLNKTGAGILYVSPTGTNTYTGGTNISAGVVDFTTIRGLPIAAATAAAITMANGTTFEYSGSGGITNQNNIFNVSGVSNLYINGTLTLTGAISGSGQLVKSGSALVYLNGTNSYSGGTTVMGGTISAPTLANGGSSSSIGNSSNAATNLVFEGGALQYTGASVSTDRLFTIGVAGGTIDASGTGPLTLSNTGSHVSTDTASGTYNTSNTSTSVTYAAGASINLAVGETVSGTGITLGSTIASINYSTNSFTLSTATTSNAAGTPTLNFGAVNRTLTLTGSNTGNNTIAGILADSSSATLGIIKSGAGTWIFSGANTYSGGTNVSSGILALANGGSFGAGSVADSAAVAFSNTATLSVGNTIGGVGTVTQSGSGNTTLSGTNTYSGTTSVNAGTLAVTGATSSSSAVTVASGATLTGTGNVAGTVNVGGTITAGVDSTHTGTLTTGNQTWGSGGSFVAKVNGTSGNDTLVMTGLTAMSSSFTVALQDLSGGATSPFTASNFSYVTGSAPAVGSYIVLATVPASVGSDPFASQIVTSKFNFNSGAVPTYSSGDSIQLASFDNSGTYDFVAEDDAAPEPTSCLLFGVVVSPILLSRRRRHSATAEPAL